MTDKPTQTTEQTKQSIGNYIALGYLNILIFYLLCYPFVKKLAQQLGYGFLEDIHDETQDFKFLLGFCILYALYSIINTIFDLIAANSPSKKSFWSLFINTYILFLLPVIFLFSILYLNMALGLSFIDYIRQPSFIYIESVFVSLFLMPIILLALLMPSWINPNKYQERVIDESITTDHQRLYIRFCNAYRHCIIGEILYRLFYLILPAILPALIIFIIFLGEWLSQLNSHYSGNTGQSGLDGPGPGLLTDHLNYILFILFVYIVFSILMRRLYTWMGKNVC